MALLNLFKSQPKIFDVSSVKYKKAVDDQIITKLTNYFQGSFKYLSKEGYHKIMVGIDGEINCLVAAKLLKQAVGENVLAMIFDIANPAWTNLIVEFCKQLGLQTYILKRGKAYQDELTTYRLHNPKSVRNFYKRFINYHLLIAADNMQAALVDTVDKNDRILGARLEGFYGHFMPFYSLYKTELYDLANHLGIPNQFRTGSVYQDLPYPDNLVLTWDKIDPVLFLLTEKQLTPEEISQAFNIDLTWLKRLKTHIDKQLFQSPVSQLII